jgi:hypothetical protein
MRVCVEDVEDETAALAIITGFEGLSAVANRSWTVLDGKTIIEAAKIYQTSDHEPFCEEMQPVGEALNAAGIAWESTGGSVGEVYGPDARWVWAVNVDTGEQYCQVMGENRDEALSQLVHVAALYGVPLEKLTVMPPL